MKTLQPAAALGLLLHLEDAAQSLRTRYCSVDATGTVAGQDDTFRSHDCQDGTVDIKARWTGQALRLHGASPAPSLHLSGQGGDLVCAQPDQTHFDITGTLAGTPVELHFSASGMNVADRGRIGDVPFQIQRYAIKNGTRLEGKLGAQPVMLFMTQEPGNHPESIHPIHWQGVLANIAVDEVVDHSAILYPPSDESPDQHG